MQKIDNDHPAGLETKLNLDADGVCILQEKSASIIISINHFVCRLVFVQKQNIASISSIDISSFHCVVSSFYSIGSNILVCACNGIICAQSMVNKSSKHVPLDTFITRNYEINNQVGWEMYVC